MNDLNLEKAVLECSPESISQENREHILSLLGLDEDFDLEKYTPVKKSSWPIKDRRTNKAWEDDVKQAALRVIRECKPIDEIKFREGDKMKDAVATYLLVLAGYEEV